MPLISVIIPIYNTEKYLRTCLESLLRQTLKDIEIVCVNDCSPDNSLDILNEYALSDNRIKIINFKENQGVSAARNAGVAEAKGKYVYFIDSDDWLDENYLSEMYEHAENQSADIVISANYINEYEDGKKKYSCFDFIEADKKYPVKTVQRLFPPVVWARLYKKSYLEKINLTFPSIKGGAEDIYYTAAAELPLKEVFIFKGSYYHYIQRPTSVMKQHSRGFHYIESFRLLYEFLKKRNLDPNGIKLFCTESLILDSREKYDFTKEYLNEIETLILSNIELYNEYEKFLYEIIKNTVDYDDFLSKYNSNISVAFIRNKMRKSVCKI